MIKWNILKKTKIPTCIVSMLLLLCACSPFGDLDNPVDPEAPNYQGFDTVADSNNINLVSPEDGLSFDFPPEFSWTPVDGAQQYHLQIAETSDFSSILYEIDDCEQGSHLVSDMSCETGDIFWRVRAKKNDEWGVWSSARMISLEDILYIGSVTPADTTDVDDTTPLLNWIPVSDASAYQVQVSETGEFSGSLLVDATDFNGSEYQLSVVLENKATYWWRARAKCAENVWGAWGSPLIFTVDIDTELPSSPDPSDSTTIANTSTVFDWADIGWAEGYQIQICDTGDFVDPLIDDSGEISESDFQSDVVLSDNTSYWWRVRAKNLDGVWGSWGNTWQFTVNIGVPSGPSPSSGSTTYDTTPLLDWGDVNGAGSYKVRFGTDELTLDQQTAYSAGSSNYQVTTSYSDGDTVYWQVQTLSDDAVGGDWSPVWNFSIAIGVPSGPSPSSGSTTYDTTPLLDWGDVNGAGSYKVRFGTDELTLDQQTAYSAGSSNYQVTTSYSDGDTVYWQVQTLSDDAIGGDWSPVWNFDVIVYDIGETGPAGGIIFYDDESDGTYDLDGDRYLEAAPASTEWSNLEWGVYGTDISGAAGTSIGTGATNTSDITWHVFFVNTNADAPAAEECSWLSYEGYDDWFLPSKDELDLMYQNLHLSGFGGFVEGEQPLGGGDYDYFYYWSSTEVNSDYAYCRTFRDGESYVRSKLNSSGYYVRAIRSF